jgi:hypothetical protein
MRTEDEESVPLFRLFAESDYHPIEMAKPDSFIDPYVGKVYRDRDGSIKWTEIVSMGIEAMWTDPAKFANDDPEHFDLIWKLMRS